MRPQYLRFGLFLALAAICPHALAGDFLHAVFPVGHRDASVEKLAKGIDYLEHHIETFGTVVAQHPDVWGQARLTKHRDEFERTMLKELDQFKPTLQATVFRSDQSYVAMALALSAAAQPSARNVTSASATAPATPQNAALGLIADPNAKDGPINRSITQPGMKTYGTESLAIEPTVFLDQMKRYLDHLHELRRINEGDDTADSPGYALNLVRIPISVLPGKRTRKGFGAELTITAEPYVTDELLPTTWRNLVINDVVDQLGLPIVSIIADNASVAKLKVALPVSSGGTRPDSQGFATNLSWASVKPDLSLESASIQRAQRRRLAYPGSQLLDVFGAPGYVFGPIALSVYKSVQNRADIRRRNLLDVQAVLQTELQAAYDFLSTDDGQVLWRHCTPELAAAVLTRQRFKDPDPYTGRSIYALRSAYFHDIDTIFPRARHTATVALIWSILVESALLNQRLIDDMQQTAVSKGCECMVGPDDWPDFYMPDPSPEAREAFNQYVRCRWPIHVFALDPVTDDQNVGDAFDRRRELQLAIAVGVAKGVISAQAAMRYVRSMETEIQTIALNRTAIGFAHGDDTFGWRFYPRVQTPPTRGNLNAFVETLVGGPSSDKDLRDRQLEPGVRECVAIVTMPSFVPNVTFDVRANWFSLTNPRKKLLTLHDTMALSRNYQAVRSAGDRVRHSHAYRPGDVSQLLRVVDQLERRLPLQSMLVQVPFENTLGGFDMFQTGVTDLGPELTGWYGAPGVRVVPPTSASGAGASPGTPAPSNAAAATTPKSSSTPAPAAPAAPTPSPTGSTTPPAGAAPTPTTPTPRAPPPAAAPNPCPGIDMHGPNQCAGTCDGTTLFLVGDHFSVHDTQVIAGGRCVPFVLLSREYMRVTIPYNVLTVPNKNDPSIKYVDVHIATPYGVSGSILIPAVFDSPPAETALGELLKTKRFTLSKPAALTISFEYDDIGAASDFKVAGKAAGTTITYSGSNQLLKLSTLPERFEVSMALKHGSDDMGPAVPVGLDPTGFKTKGELAVSAPQVLAAVDQILSAQSDVTNRYTNGGATTISFQAVFYVQVGDRPPPSPPAGQRAAMTPAPTLPIEVEGTLPIQLLLRTAKPAGAAAWGSSRAPVPRVPPPQIRPPQPDVPGGPNGLDQELPEPDVEQPPERQPPQEGGWRPAARSAAALARKAKENRRQQPFRPHSVDAITGAIAVN